MKINQAVILAGGLGTRLKPYTDVIPKPLIEVRGKPFLVWQLEYLKGQGIKKILLLVSYMGEKIETYFKQNPIAGLNISFHAELSPMGTGGALKHAEKLLENKFWLLNGDTLLKLKLSEIEASANPNLIVCFNDPKAVGVSGNIVVKNNKAIGYGENTDFVDAGVYLLSKSLVETHKSGTFPLSSLLEQAMKLNQVCSYITDLPFYDMGTIERLNNAPKSLFSSKKD
jgi:NDP-sugar pyrophosphorylase family protein